MIQFTATPVVAHCGRLATACFPQKIGDTTPAGTERVDDLVSELLTTAYDFVRRHRLTDVEYEALQAWLIKVSAKDGWHVVLDDILERVIPKAANGERRGSEEGIGHPPDEPGRAGVSLIRSEYGHNRVLATVLFTDIVDSTRCTAELGDRNWLKLLGRHDEVTRAEIARFHGRVIRHTGDGVVAIFDHPSCAVQSAATLTDCMREMGIDIRCGLHTGECELRGDDIGGIAVHTGARIAALAQPREVLVSNTVKDLMNGSGIAFHDRGVHLLKGVPGQWRLFACS
jgi:class 3 adenylate cyclase